MELWGDASTVPLTTGDAAEICGRPFGRSPSSHEIERGRALHSILSECLLIGRVGRRFTTVQPRGLYSSEASEPVMPSEHAIKC